MTAYRQTLPFVCALILCATPYVTSPTALVLGFFLSSFGLIPTGLPIAKITKKLLSYSIIGLGFGIPFEQALRVTSHGIGLIMVTIFSTLIAGWYISKKIGLEHKTGYLIASGTAICGGSAIAAVAPAINADDDQIGLALGTVFALNSVALFIFPAIGHWFHLSQYDFGTWAAIAIHDTSSVVGAASAYGEEALKTATTLKLARALWIIPVALISALLFQRQSKTIKVPYFIFLYCGAIAISDALPGYETLYVSIFSLAKQALVVCLMLIGCGLSFERLKAAGSRPLLFGVGLWVTISASSLTWIRLGS